MLRVKDIKTLRKLKNNNKVNELALVEDACINGMVVIGRVMSLQKESILLCMKSTRPQLPDYQLAEKEN